MWFHSKFIPCALSVSNHVWINNWKKYYIWSVILYITCSINKPVWFHSKYTSYALNVSNHVPIQNWKKYYVWSLIYYITCNIDKLSMNPLKIYFVCSHYRKSRFMKDHVSLKTNLRFVLKIYTHIRILNVYVKKWRCEGHTNSLKSHSKSSSNL